MSKKKPIVLEELPIGPKGQKYQVETGEVVEHKGRNGFGIPCMKVETFDTLDEAKKYATSIGERDVTEVIHIEGKHWRIGRTFFAPVADPNESRGVL